MPSGSRPPIRKPDLQQDGDLVALVDQALLRIDEDGGVDRAEIDVPSSTSCEDHQRSSASRALHPDVTAQELPALTRRNVLIASPSDQVDLIDVQEIAFAPSGDPAATPR